MMRSRLQLAFFVWAFSINAAASASINRSELEQGSRQSESIHGPRLQDDSLEMLSSSSSSLSSRQLQNDFFCYDALAVADENQDRKVTDEEYITFLKIMSPSGYLTDIETFQDLPPVLQNNFIILACMCLDQTSDGPSDPQCCVGGNAHISNIGVFPGEIVAAPAAAIYLNTVCFLTETSIDRYLETATKTPTTQPSKSPTMTPTTPAPTPLPTTAPVTPSPTTSSPSVAPTKEPTLPPQEEAPIVRVAKVNYVVGIQGDSSSSYSEDLVAAMNRMAPIIATDLIRGNNDRQRRMLLRHLEAVTVTVPTTLDGTITSVCPTFIPENDRCEDVIASVTLSLDASQTNSPGKVVDEYEEALGDAISNGSLQSALNEVAPNSPVYIVTGLDASSFQMSDKETTLKSINDGNNNDNGLLSSPAAIAGLAAVAAVGCMFLSLLVVRRRRRLRDEEFYVKEHSDSNYMKDLESPVTEVSSPMSTPTDRGFMTPPSNKKLSSSKKTLSMGSKSLSKPAASATMNSKDDEDDDESSHAGSSGWSSQGGESSDEDDYSADGCLGINDKKAKKGMQNSFSELDEAIQTGDWAAVGVTAALLASRPHGGQQHNAEGSNATTYTTIGSSLRQEDIDQLVEARDWQGIAAAVSHKRRDMRDTSSAATWNGDQSVSSRGSITIFSGSGTGFSHQTPSERTTSTEAQSREHRLEEVRKEVEELIQHVVPEERTHIDEMISHFHGNEEVLIETLRTMRERAIAQKAREESHQMTRQKMKSQKQQQRQLYGAVDNTGAPADDSWINEIENEKTGAGNKMHSEHEEHTEVSVTDVLRETMAGITEAFSHSISMGGSSSSRSNRASNNENQDVDALVNKGDWEAVVLAASRKKS